MSTMLDEPLPCVWRVYPDRCGDCTQCRAKATLDALRSEVDELRAEIARRGRAEEIRLLSMQYARSPIEGPCYPEEGWDARYPHVHNFEREWGTDAIDKCAKCGRRIGK